MASLLLDIATYLQQNGIVEGDGVDTFRDTIPDSPDDIIILYEYQGDPTNPLFELQHRSVQIKVRNRNADAARQKALEIFKLLNVETHLIYFVEGRLSLVYLRQTPMKIETDGKRRTIYGFNIGITTSEE